MRIHYTVYNVLKLKYDYNNKSYNIFLLFVYICICTDLFFTLFSLSLLKPQWDFKK